MSRRRRLLLFVLWTVVATLIIVELGLRTVDLLDLTEVGAWIKDSLIAFDNPTSIRSTFRGDSLLMWSMVPGLKDFKMTAKRGGDGVDFILNTNRLGLRGPEVRKKRDQYRILALGDSCTFGLWVNDDETWPAQLQRLSDESEGRGTFEVLNAGVVGYSSFQGLRYLEKRGLKLKPDLVIAEFGTNDSLWWTDGATDMAHARVVGIEPWEWPFAWSQAFRMVRVIQKQKRLRAEADATRQNPDQAESSDPGSGGRLTSREMREMLTKMYDACHSAGIPIIFVIWSRGHQTPVPSSSGPDSPASERRYWQVDIARVARNMGASLIDLAPAFDAAKGTRLFVDGYHANATGCRIVAESVKSEVLKLAKQARQKPKP